MQYLPIPTDLAHAYQSGAPDAYGHVPERVKSDGGGNPCRHCLSFIPAGAEMLVLAHRPFSETQPYAETGPVFLCATPCDAPASAAERPEVMENGSNLLVRGYGEDERIVYGSGKAVPCGEVEDHAAALFQRPEISYVHVRSATNNCFLLRIERDVLSAA